MPYDPANRGEVVLLYCCPLYFPWSFGSWVLFTGVAVVELRRAGSPGRSVIDCVVFR